MRDKKAEVNMANANGSNFPTPTDEKNLLTGPAKRVLQKKLSRFFRRTNRNHSEVRKSNSSYSNIEEDQEESPQANSESDELLCPYENADTTDEEYLCRRRVRFSEERQLTAMEKTAKRLKRKLKLSFLRKNAKPKSILKSSIQRESVEDKKEIINLHKQNSPHVFKRKMNDRLTFLTFRPTLHAEPKTRREDKRVGTGCKLINEKADERNYFSISESMNRREVVELEGSCWDEIIASSTQTELHPSTANNSSKTKGNVFTLADLFAELAISSSSRPGTRPDIEIKTHSAAVQNTE